MKQEILVNTKIRKMFVKENGKIIKTVDDVSFGKNGACDYKDMKEGGKKTPLGTYNLGIAFGTHKLNIKYPYIKIDENCYWIDDVDSKYYNCLVSKKTIEDFGYKYVYSNVSNYLSAEHLIDYKGYEYAIFIEYNTRRIKNKGSAIFLHCKERPYTLGCISIPKNDMKWLINYIDITKNPTIKII